MQRRVSSLRLHDVLSLQFAANHSHTDYAKNTCICGYVETWSSVVQCYSAEQLLRSFDVDETNGVTRSDFHRLCPALVQQASHACQSPTATTTNTTDDTKPSDAEGRLNTVQFASLSVTVHDLNYNTPPCIESKTVKPKC